jgi:anti-sigma regulatory factor (Ser/Thr protein kinase)
MTDESLDDEASFDLQFLPNVGVVNLVRRFVGDFYSKVLGDAETTSKLTLATHELLENAVRYASDPFTRVHVEVVRTGTTVRVSVETRNRTTPSHRDALLGLIEEITSAPDANAQYLAMMRRSAKRTDGSGLGLGRIRAEADMHLTCAIEGDLVALKAETSYTTPEAA